MKLGNVSDSGSQFTGTAINPARALDPAIVLHCRWNIGHHTAWYVGAHLELGVASDLSQGRFQNKSETKKGRYDGKCSRHTACNVGAHLEFCVASDLSQGQGHSLLSRHVLEQLGCS